MCMPTEKGNITFGRIWIMCEESGAEKKMILECKSNDAFLLLHCTSIYYSLF